MKQRVSAYFILICCVLTFTGTGTALQLEIPCTVKLRKGKTLIIRNQNGKRLPGTLANGTKVTAVEMADGDGPGAAQIAVTRKGKRVVLGWVSQADLSCKYQ